MSIAAIPQMVDVDGHIDDSLLRWGEGCYVRAMAEVLEPRWEDETETVAWEYGRDTYSFQAADEWLPQPPSALDAWERELHGLRPTYRTLVGCGCPMCSGGTTDRYTLSTLRDTYSGELMQALLTMSRRMEEAYRNMVTLAFSASPPLGIWIEPPPQPVTCPDLVRPDDTTARLADWALAPTLTIDPDRFKPTPRPMELPATTTESQAFWDRPRPRRTA